MSAKIKLEVSYSEDSLVILIDGLEHLDLKISKFIGFQSWVQGYGKTRRYIIEYTSKYKDVVITSEYDQYSKWAAILKLLRKEKIWSSRG